MKFTTLTAAGLAALYLVACGDDDTTGSVTSAPTAPTPANSAVPPQTPEVTSAPQVETVTPTPTSEPPEPPEGEGIEGLPSTTPIPGPPVKFRVTITDDAIAANAETLPEHRDFKIFVFNEDDEGVSYTVRSHGNIVGAGFIEPGDDTFVLVRNLLPGKLTLASGKLRRTVQVLPAD